jgi:hypothetical protein
MFTIAPFAGIGILGQLIHLIKTSKMTGQAKSLVAGIIEMTMEHKLEQIAYRVEDDGQEEEMNYRVYVYGLDPDGSKRKVFYHPQLAICFPQQLHKWCCTNREGIVELVIC